MIRLFMNQWNITAKIEKLMHWRNDNAKKPFISKGEEGENKKTSIN